MSSWEFDVENLKIRNIAHGSWEIDLSSIRGTDDLLYWLLQAAQHQFNLPELFSTFREAIEFCFGMEGVNGAAMLKDLFDVYPSASGPVSWEDGRVGTAS